VRLLCVLVVLAIAAVSCASGEPSSGPPIVVTPGEVSALADGTRVTVTGSLFIQEDARLCEVMLESYPPQCGGGSVVLADFDPDSVVGLSSPTDPTFAAVTWTDFPLTLDGVVAGGRLTVTGAAHQVFRGEAAGIVTRVMPVVMQSGVVFAMDATNTTADAVTAMFPDGQDAEVVLHDASGAEVYRWSEGKAFDMAIRTIEIPAGGAITTLLHDEVTLEHGWAIEAFFVADALMAAVATGTVVVAG
jgi:Intracellular proteinase inhibitor